MRKAYYKRHSLQFKRPAGTSRGVLKNKDTWYLIIEEQNNTGIGECGMFVGLSIDDRPDFEEKLQWVCDHIHKPEAELYESLKEFPAIQIGLETALRSLESNTPAEIFPSAFSNGSDSIIINGLIWMGDKEFMQEQVGRKLADGFNCIKMKIGAIDFQTELAILAAIREQFASDVIELRVDANGAFTPNEAIGKLKALSAFDLHSIEQPIQQGQWKEMKLLCSESPFPIALDEELIGLFDREIKEELLDTVNPQYIILKPTLIGGFRGCDEWIELAESRGIGWWITSALESNIGLNAISQYTYLKSSKLPQGLGTGELFVNNIPSPLEVTQGKLHYHLEKSWDYRLLDLNT